MTAVFACAVCFALGVVVGVLWAHVETERMIRRMK
jgi:hypothetical protein